MDKGLYVAMTGAQANLKAQAMVSHNLANVDTAGFKAALVRTDPFQIQGDGQKTRISAMPAVAGFNNGGGATITTGNALDVALTRENLWLAVQAKDGSEAYTRFGELRVDANGLLSTARGELVLSQNGAPLAVPPYQSIQIGADGSISLTPQSENPTANAVVGRIRVVEVDASKLTRAADGLMRLQPDQFPPEQANGNLITAGAIEGSNVDAAEALVQMISLSRQFEMNIRLIRAGDDNAQSANTLLRSR